jgi:aryl-alcohol dehydrogenase-like predicted oxidoreductase
VIATKGGHPAAGEGYLRPEDFLAPEVLARDVAESLERLGVDTIDLYWLHRDDPRRPLGEILEALNADIACGHLRALGASNWSIARLSEANTYAAAHGLHGFVASQPQWSLAHPNAPVPTEDPAMRYLMPDDQAWHAATGLPVIPYSSTACGYFASGGQKAAGAFDNAISRGRLARAEALADTHGATPNQIALAYLHHQPFPVIPILGTLNLAHLQDAMGMAAVHLTAEEVRWLAEGEHA